MSEATAPLPAPEQNPRGMEAIGEDILAAHHLLLAALADLDVRFAGETGDTPRILAVRQVADVQADLRGLRKELSAATEAERLRASVGLSAELDQMYAAAEVPAPVRRRASHRAPRQNPGQLKLLGLAPVPAPVAAFAFRHGLTGWHAVAAGTAATVIGGTALAGGVIAFAPSNSPHGAASSPNPAASVVAAVPVTPGSFTSPLPSASQKASTNGQGWVAAPIPPPLPGSGPASPQGQSPQGEPSSQAAVHATLSVQGALDLGTLGTGTLEISASDGSGWLSWSASSDTAGVILGDSHGVLRGGQSASVTVSVTSALQALTGPATVTVRTGSGQVVQVQVTWTLVPLPLPSLPDPLPSLPNVLGG